MDNLAKSDKPDTQAEVGKDEPDRKVKDESDAPSKTSRTPEDPALEAQGERPDISDAGTDPDDGSSRASDLPEPALPEEVSENPWKTSPDTENAAFDEMVAGETPEKTKSIIEPEPEDAFAPDRTERAETVQAEEDPEKLDTEKPGATQPETALPPETDPARDTAPPVAGPPPTPEPRRGGFLPMLIGGALAAVLGFVAARGEWIDPYLPEQYRQQAVDIAPLQERLDAQAGENAALTARIEELSATLGELQATSPAPTELPEEVSSELVTLTGRIEALEALQARVEALESRPVVEAPSEEVATTADVAGLQAALDAQRAEIAALAEQAEAAEADAQSEAQKVLAQAALARLAAAVDSGEPFAPALGALEDVAPVPVPDALQAAAAEGVATLAELQAAFPEAARAALAAVRAETAENEATGLGSFIQRQLGARSVVPREGDDADAVLSRTEAAIREGSLDAALVELESLPESGRTAMQDWIQSAEARNAVRQAAAGLEDSLNSN